MYVLRSNAPVPSPVRDSKDPPAPRGSSAPLFESQVSIRRLISRSRSPGSATVASNEYAAKLCIEFPRWTMSDAIRGSHGAASGRYPRSQLQLRNAPLTLAVGASALNRGERRSRGGRRLLERRASTAGSHAIAVRRRSPSAMRCCVAARIRPIADSGRPLNAIRERWLCAVPMREESPDDSVERSKRHPTQREGLECK